MEQIHYYLGNRVRDSRSYFCAVLKLERSNPPVNDLMSTLSFRRPGPLNSLPPNQVRNLSNVVVQPGIGAAVPADFLIRVNGRGVVKAE